MDELDRILIVETDVYLLKSKLLLELRLKSLKVTGWKQEWTVLSNYHGIKTWIKNKVKK